MKIIAKIPHRNQKKKRKNWKIPHRNPEKKPEKIGSEWALAPQDLPLSSPLAERGGQQGMGVLEQWENHGKIIGKPWENTMMHGYMESEWKNQL